MLKLSKGGGGGGGGGGGDQARASSGAENHPPQSPLGLGENGKDQSQRSTSKAVASSDAVESAKSATASLTATPDTKGGGTGGPPLGSLSTRRLRLHSLHLQH